MIIDKLIPIYNKYFMEIYTNNMDKFTKSHLSDSIDFSKIDLSKQEDVMRLIQAVQSNKDDIYDNNIIPVDTYIEAWKLRGDNPEYYINDNERKKLNFWDRCAIRNGNAKIAENKIIKELYLNYHYNPKIKSKGNEREVFKIDSFIIEAVRLVQKEMQVYIRERGIGIETNPSSNYLISTFKRYDKHPILNLYNLGLTIDENEAERYSQMFVSINTDDQGVFGTLLENEYALMAIALEKAKDSEGNPKYNQAMIYDWLDRIRKMGIEQSFKIPNND